MFLLKTTKQFTVDRKALSRSKLELKVAMWSFVQSENIMKEMHCLVMNNIKQAGVSRQAVQP